ncbi:MAG TPA: flavodoxin domain-containing protein [Roseiflexaceae bacterium]|nr:flavodoxin domain-containing protein [Roseiflexaceae bacterium]
MRALIVYASWFGHNRTIARLIAAELAERDVIADCIPISKVSAHDLAEYDLLVLGTYTHLGRASGRMRAFCEAIPLRLLDRVTVALFGTQVVQDQPHLGGTSGVDDLESRLLSRGCELALAPLRIELPADRALLSSKELGPADLRVVKEFAADLWEVSVAAPLI